jgi:phage shock protein PspC (stress-responsive transcriptional regulator)
LSSVSTSPGSGQPPTGPAPRSGGLGWVREQFAGAGLYRPATGRLLAGVLAGIARRVGVSPLVLRIAFVVSIFLPGPQFLLYLVLWIGMPQEQQTLP